MGEQAAGGPWIERVLLSRGKEALLDGWPQGTDASTERERERLQQENARQSRHNPRPRKQHGGGVLPSWLVSLVLVLVPSISHSGVPLEACL